MIRKTLVLVAAGTAAWLATSAAMAAGADDLRSVRVSYADLDLTHPAGVAHMVARLRRASEIVCAGPDNRDLKALAAERACQQHAMTAALQQVSHSTPAAHLAPADIERYAALNR
jgi:UrcA family protein